MAHTDTIADMLTRIRNAVTATHETVDIPASKLKVEIAKVLQHEGYINSYQLIEDDPIKKKVRIHLKYGPRGEKLISGIKRISTPGLRVYKNAKSLPKVFGGLGISIVSTSQGLRTDRQARKENVGGEILCQVW